MPPFTVCQTLAFAHMADITGTLAVSVGVFAHSLTLFGHNLKHCWLRGAYVDLHRDTEPGN